MSPKIGFLFLATLAWLALGSLAPAQAENRLTMEQAVAIALTRNFEVIAQKLNIEAAELERVQAGLYPNPVFGYAVGNLVVGTHNPQTNPPIPAPGFFGQTQHALSISGIIDVWAKRNTRITTAERSAALTRLRVQDALREIAYAVRTAFAEVLREQAERDLAKKTRARYDETVRISRARFMGGDISEADYRKVELEGLRYQSNEIDATMQLDLMRQKLAGLLGFASVAELPGEPVATEARRMALDPGTLIERALHDRPDVQAALTQKTVSQAALSQARREALPDLTLSLSYLHSEFQASGDNPNSLGMGLSFPLPLFDRNQASIGRAKLEGQRAENEAQRLYVQVQQDVLFAVRRFGRATELLSIYEGGMLDRADTALHVAEKTYRAGASSLLDLLEAQRTYLSTRAQYALVQHDYRLALIDLMHAINGDIK